MELSIFIARIISIIYIFSGVAVLVKTVNLNQFVDEFDKSPTMTYLAGCFGIIFGMILVNYHNHWVGNWTVLITLIAWIMLIGGILVIVFPKSILRYKKFATGSRYWGVFMILFGLLFGYFGFLFG